MKRWAVRVIVTSILYLLALSGLVILLHILNSFSPMPPREFFIVTVIVIGSFSIGLFFGTIRYYRKRKK
jgi:hypothetical protein